MLMESILENHNLLTQYRNLYKSQLSLNAVINMVFLEKNLPFTFSYLFDNLSGYLSNLPKNIDPNQLSIAEKSILEANTIIKLIDIDLLSSYDEKTMMRTHLEETLDKVYNLTALASVHLTSLYFNHSMIQHSILDNLYTLTTNEI